MEILVMQVFNDINGMKHVAANSAGTVSQDPNVLCNDRRVARLVLARNSLAAIG
jgi:hypothetical protein